MRLDKKPSPLPPPDLSNETDCDDQGFSLISDGCVSCVVGFTPKGKPMHPQFIKQQSPGNRQLRGGGPWYWVCPNCKGYYGECSAPRRVGGRADG